MRRPKRIVAKACNTQSDPSTRTPPEIAAVLGAEKAGECVDDAGEGTARDMEGNIVWGERAERKKKALRHGLHMEDITVH